MVLHRGPDDGERLLYTRPDNRLLSVAQLVAWTGLTVALIRFSHNSVWLLPFLLWAVLGAAYFALSFAANTSYRHDFDLAAHDRATAALRARAGPSVDVFLPSCGEPLAILENTFGHVAALRWRGPLRVYCLDDSGRTEVRVLAEEFGFEYLARPNAGEFKKAGNLRYGYLRSSGEFIAVFDADFCPRSSFLEELVPYALGDPGIGIVQSPQYFASDPAMNWLENGAGQVQEFFYRWVMPGRDVRHSPICVGTNAVYRRSALERTDGGALVYNSEDVHTGFDLMAVGYRTKYVPVILAKGLCPNTLQSFFNQQHRWCSGSMSLLFSHKFWHERIGLRARLTFLAGMSYFLYTGLGIVVGPLPAAVMVCFFPAKVLLSNYLLLVPALLQNFVFLPRWHRCRYGLSAMRTKVVYAWAHLFAFRDKLAGRPLQWSPTGGAGSGRPSRRLGLVKWLLVAWPMTVLAGVLGGSIAHMASPLDLAYWPPIALATVWASVSVAVLAPLGRTTYLAPDGDAVDPPHPPVRGSTVHIEAWVPVPVEPALADPVSDPADR